MNFKRFLFPLFRDQLTSYVIMMHHLDGASLPLSLSLSLPLFRSLFSPSFFLARVVKELLNKEVETAIDVDEDGNTPLHLACISGSYKVAKVIIENKAADVEAR